MMANTEAISDRFGHQNRHVLVTGGSKGIGNAVVNAFAELGANVYTCARTQEALQEALEQWQSDGLQVHGCLADVSTVEGRHALAAAVEEHFAGTQTVRFADKLTLRP
jgi:NAD(P)-dependent dehydrogenase (short-subunit alcohol dehydrogenase family)